MFFEGDYKHKIDSLENALSTLITIGNCFVLYKTLHAALLIWLRVCEPQNGFPPPNFYH